MTCLALMDFDAVEAFCDRNSIGNEGGRSCFFTYIYFTATSKLIAPFSGLW